MSKYNDHFNYSKKGKNTTIHINLDDDEFEKYNLSDEDIADIKNISKKIKSAINNSVSSITGNLHFSNLDRMGDDLGKMGDDISDYVSEIINKVYTPDRKTANDMRNYCSHFTSSFEMSWFTEKNRINDIFQSTFSRIYSQSND